MINISICMRARASLRLCLCAFVRAPQKISIRARVAADVAAAAILNWPQEERALVTQTERHVRTHVSKHARNNYGTTNQQQQQKPTRSHRARACINAFTPDAPVRCICGVFCRRYRRCFRHV